MSVALSILEYQQVHPLERYRGWCSRVRPLYSVVAYSPGKPGSAVWGATLVEADIGTRCALAYPLRDAALEDISEGVVDLPPCSEGPLDFFEFDRRVLSWATSQGCTSALVLLPEAGRQPDLTGLNLRMQAHHEVAAARRLFPESVWRQPDALGPVEWAAALGKVFSAVYRLETRDDRRETSKPWVLELTSRIRRAAELSPELRAFEPQGLAVALGVLGLAFQDGPAEVVQELQVGVLTAGAACRQVFARMPQERLVEWQQAMDAVMLQPGARGGTSPLMLRASVVDWAVEVLHPACVGPAAGALLAALTTLAAR